ncbi:MAG: hypothetical protein KKG47_08005 [Proteobacteria bacterium]|nr:hypothetical protein [Pseudomonadota bacterium]MBU1738242.1 hypothetical protein [Pseudomonadota bacterium]
MLNKRILLGSLVAGAFMLPMAVNAGVVSGPCVNCHTMHNSQSGGAVNTTEDTLNASLLKGAGCEGCHADSANSGTTGRGTGAVPAPQVNDATNPNLAGYFVNTASYVDANMHNVYTDLALVFTDGSNAGTPPGSTPGTDVATCSRCHTLAGGGHHGNASTVYRMLFDGSGTDMAADANYGGGVGDVVNGVNYPNTAATTYDSESMNEFCARCHGDFHGAGITVQGGPDKGQGTPAAWLRHPTDYRLNDGGATYNYLTNYTTAAVQDVIPLGTSSSNIFGGATTAGVNTLMCITCHFSHGGPYADLLRFDYSLQQAQITGGTNTPGCESCHGYGVAGASGM